MQRLLNWASALPFLVAAAATGQSPAGEIVARVNGVEIRRKAIDDVVEGTQALESAADARTSLHRLRLGALDSLIELELLYQAGVVAGVSVDAEEVEREIRRNVSRFPDPKSFRDALKERGMSEDELRQETLRMLTVNRYLERAVGHVTISTEEVGDFYRTHRAEFHRPAQVRASHILMRVEADDGDDRRRAAAERAARILAELLQGGDFSELARKHSEDRATAAKGGDLGFFARGTMVQAFEQPVFALLPGQITGVFETKYGFHIAKVTDRKLEGTRSLEDVSDRIREHLAELERQRRRDAHTEALRRAARIEILDPAFSESER